jgi:hypothetical protein
MVEVETLVSATEYPMIWLPPSVVGAVQSIVAEAFPGVAVTPVGVPGDVAAGNVTVVGEEEIELYVPSPAIVAVTTHVPGDCAVRASPSTEHPAEPLVATKLTAELFRAIDHGTSPELAGATVATTASEVVLTTCT